MPGKIPHSAGNCLLNAGAKDVRRFSRFNLPPVPLVYNLKVWHDKKQVLIDVIFDLDPNGPLAFVAERVS